MIKLLIFINMFYITLFYITLKCYNIYVREDRFIEMKYIISLLLITIVFSIVTIYLYVKKENKGDIATLMGILCAMFSAIVTLLLVIIDYQGYKLDIIFKDGRGIKRDNDIFLVKKDDLVAMSIYPDDYWYPNICNNGNSVANNVKVKIFFDNIAFPSNVDNYSIVDGNYGIGGYSGLVYDIPNSILPGDCTYLPSIDFSKAYLYDNDVNSDKMTFSIYSENSKKIEYSYNISFKEMSDEYKDIFDVEK